MAVAAVALSGCSSDDSDNDTGDSGATTTTPVAASSEPAGAQVEPVAEFSGEGNETTESFDVEVNWELRWRVSEGERFAVELLTNDDVSRGHVVDATDKSEGTTFVSEAGEFKLRVSSDAPWSVQIVSKRAVPPEGTTATTA